MFFQFYDIEKDKGTIVMLDGKTVTPLYVQLMNQIEEKIRCGVYQPGERLQSESEMAKTFGVSIITVRSAVSGLVEKRLGREETGKRDLCFKTKIHQGYEKSSKLHRNVPVYGNGARRKNAGKLSCIPR